MSSVDFNTDRSPSSADMGWVGIRFVTCNVLRWAALSWRVTCLENVVAVNTQMELPTTAIGWGAWLPCGRPVAFMPPNVLCPHNVLIQKNLPVTEAGSRYWLLSLSNACRSRTIIWRCCLTSWSCGGCRKHGGGRRLAVEKLFDSYHFRFICLKLVTTSRLPLNSKDKNSSLVVFLQRSRRF